MFRREGDCVVLTLWQDAEPVAALMRSNTYARTVSEIIAKRFLPGDQCVETFKVHPLSDLPTSGAKIVYGPDGPRTGPQRPRATKDRPSWLLASRASVGGSHVAFEGSAPRCEKTAWPCRWSYGRGPIVAHPARSTFPFSPACPRAAVSSCQPWHKRTGSQSGRANIAFAWTI